MQRLATDELPSARQLFTGMDVHLALVSALAGEIPADVYVNDPGEPTAGVLFPPNRYRIYLAGQPSAGFSEALRTVLGQRYEATAPSTSPRTVVIHYSGAVWEPVLDEMLAGVESERLERLHLRLQADVVSPTFQPPEGIMVRPVEPAIWESERLAYSDELVSEMLSESPTVEHFLRHEHGSCAQHGDELVGWCLSEYSHAGQCELGVETSPSYQRRGVASATAAATIAQAVERGRTEIGWHCWDDNEASIALARRLGFAETARYPVWLCRFARLPSV